MLCKPLNTYCYEVNSALSYQIRFVGDEQGYETPLGRAAERANLTGMLAQGRFLKRKCRW